MADSCGAYVSADDLKAAKESILHIEHVATSKDANGDPALVVTDPIRGVGYTNATLDGLFSNIGFKPVNGSFEDGGTLNNRWEVLLYEADGTFYQWMGSLPKVVPAGSTPASTGGIGPGAWVDQSDLTLRSQLTSSDGATLIGSDVVISFNTVAEMKSATWIQERMIVRTKGYLSSGDGGHASYRIVSSSPGGLGFSNHALSNGLYATIMVDSVVFLEQVGGLLADSSDAFYAAMSLSKDVRSRSARTYLISKTIYIPSYTTIDLKGSTVSFTGSTYVDYFMPDGNDSSRNKNITIKNAKINLFYTYGVTTGLPAWNTQSHGNGVVAIRMKYCDGFTIENIEASGGHYGIEIKTSTKGTVRGCIFHDNIDDGISISDGDVVSVQSSDILVELCESYSNGFNDNNVGNSGFEVDDGPRNITFYKCYAHNNESRGFACHVHSGSDESLVCYGIRFIECRAENNNNYLQTAAGYADNNCGFGFSSASNVTKRVYDILIDKCQTSGHKQGSIMWYRSGSVTDSGLTVSNCNFSDSLAVNGGIRTYLVSDIKIINNTMSGGSSCVGVRVFDCRGDMRIDSNSISGYGLGDVQIVGTSLAARVWITDNNLSGTTSRTTDSISCVLCLRVVISGNRLSDDVSSSNSAIYVGQSTSSNTSKYISIVNNYVFGHAIGVYNRGATSLSIQGNTFDSTSQVLSHAITTNGICLLQNNMFLNCGSDGASGADSSSGNIAKTF